MKIQVHPPRESEAKLEPTLRADLTITPRFYKKTGFVTVFYFTVMSAKGREEKYAFNISANNMQPRIERLVEVIPACDERDPTSAEQDTDNEQRDTE